MKLDNRTTIRKLQASETKYLVTQEAKAVATKEMKEKT